MNNVISLLHKSSEIHPDKTAIIFNENHISYKMLQEGTERLAAGFKNMGLDQGDRVALMLPNVPHFVMTYFALLQLGVTIVPVSIYYKAEEVHHLLEDSEAAGIIYWEVFRKEVEQAIQNLDHCRYRIVLGDEVNQEEIRLNHLIETNEPYSEIVDCSNNETALVVYTAGATGRPIGAELTHDNILFDVEAIRRYLKIECCASVLAPIPFYHPLGHTLTMGTFIQAGATLVLMPKFEAEEIFKMAGEYKPSYLAATPSMLRAMILLDPQGERDLASLKYILVSGEALKNETKEAFEKGYRVPVLEGYGLTEASPIVSFNTLKQDRTAGSIGLPLPGVDIKIVGEDGEEVGIDEVGEIIVRGGNVMKGYLNRPAATKKALRDGWLHTGDLAKLDVNGLAFIVVRKKNVIIKSGFNVYPREVEKYLLAHPKIKEAVIVGLPDPNLGEEIHACIVLKENETATPTELIEYSRERLAAYKCPKTVTFFDEIHKGPNGRILRNTTKEYLSKKIVNIGNYH